MLVFSRLKNYLKAFGTIGSFLPMFIRFSVSILLDKGLYWNLYIALASLTWMYGQTDSNMWKQTSKNHIIYIQNVTKFWQLNFLAWEKTLSNLIDRELFYYAHLSQCCPHIAVLSVRTIDRGAVIVYKMCHMFYLYRAIVVYWRTLYKMTMIGQCRSPKYQYKFSLCLHWYVYDNKSQ